MGRTRKPCPGCGEVDERRAADAVCRHCKSLMEDGKRFREQTKKSRCQITRVPDTHYGYPYIRYNDMATRDAFQLAFHEVVIACSAPTAEIEWETARAARVLFPHRDGHHDGYVLLSLATIQALQSVYDGCVALVEEAYRDGLEHGRSFIRDLASGAATIAEFNAHTLGHEEAASHG